MNRRHKRLVFCITSGRSGSSYLASLLDSAQEMVCWHEREPRMNREYLQMINARSYEETREQRSVKCGGIAQDLEALPPGSVYGDTTHMFIKTFFDVVLATFDNVEVIILRRNLATVLRSFIELAYFSPLNASWPNWMSSPNARTAALPCIGPDDSLDQYDRTIAYLLDIEARGARFRRQYPAIPVHEVRLEELNDMTVVKDLFRRLRVTATGNTEQLCGRMMNSRDERKDLFKNPTTIDYCRRRIAEYLAKARALGIVIPESAALDGIG